MKKRLPFLADALLLAGGLCLIIPTIGNYHSAVRASPKLALLILNLVYFLVIAFKISKSEETSNNASN